MKLNLGCGKRVLEGYINCDTRDLPGVDRILDVRDKLPWGKNTIDGIEASHILEHVEAHKTKRILANMFWVLKPGGIVSIEAPDVEAVFKRWQTATHKEKWFYCGEQPRYPSLFHYIWGQGNVQEGQCHLQGFDRERLERLMGDAGFVEIEKKRSRLGLSIRLQGRKPGDKD